MGFGVVFFVSHKGYKAYKERKREVNKLSAL
jgi:hypothetical protein